MIPVFSVVAYSGTGKTTFIEKLIPELKKKGLRVAVVKHDAHEFEIDKEGKDSDRITKAGADITGLVCASKSVLMENRPRDIRYIFKNIRDVDVILTEGYKTGKWPKIMLHREATGKPLPLDPAACMAVVSDVPVASAKRIYSFDDADQIAEMICKRIIHQKKISLIFRRIFRFRKHKKTGYSDESHLR